MIVGLKRVSGHSSVLRCYGKCCCTVLTSGKEGGKEGNRLSLLYCNEAKAAICALMPAIGEAGRSCRDGARFVWPVISDHKEINNNNVYNDGCDTPGVVNPITSMCYFYIIISSSNRELLCYLCPVAFKLASVFVPPI
jgi:hypothetical protein